MQNLWRDLPKGSWISFNKLQKWVKFSISVTELTERLSSAGIPVFGVRCDGKGLEQVVAARIVKVKEHPQSDHLKICTLDIGSMNKIVILTGAANVLPGQMVPAALPGACLPNGKKIVRSRLRGTDSMGMLCSTDELGIEIEDLPEEQKTGVYILSGEIVPGTSMKEVLGLDDVLFQISTEQTCKYCGGECWLARILLILTKGSWSREKGAECPAHLAMNGQAEYKTFSFLWQDMEDYTGYGFTEKQALTVWEQMGLAITAKQGGRYEVKTSFPLNNMKDLFDWTLRLIGWKALPSQKPSYSAFAVKNSLGLLRQQVCSMGLEEAISLEGLEGQDPFTWLWKEADTLTGKNSRGVFCIKGMFEACSSPCVYGIIQGNRFPQHWLDETARVDFYDAKGVVESLLEKWGLEAGNVILGGLEGLSPEKSVLFQCHWETIAGAGKLSGEVVQQEGDIRPVYGFFVKLQPLFMHQRKFKKNTLDKLFLQDCVLDFSWDAQFSAAEIDKALQKKLGKCLWELDWLEREIYPEDMERVRGKIHIVLQSPETWREEEYTSLKDRAAKALIRKFSAKILA